MSPEDPRHGTVAGYNRIPCRDVCCRRAMANYRNRWVWDQMNSRLRIVSTIGTRRRIQALNRLGWSTASIAARVGVPATNMTRLLYGQTMTATLAGRFAKVYDEMSMTLPTENINIIRRTRNRAERMGWPPPLAWDDIDNDPEPPAADNVDEPDEAVVERLLAGAWEHPSTPAERAEAARRWHASGRSLHDLAKRTGWKVERYYKASDEEAA